jgi:hypothetical protein
VFAGVLPAVVLLCACLVPSGALASTGFGVSTFTMVTTRENGQPYPNESREPEPFTQAGGHPYALTTTIAFNTETLTSGTVVPVRDPKDVTVDLPPGLLGDPQATPRCPIASFDAGDSACPASTQVGTATIDREGGLAAGGIDEFDDVYNLTPEAGQSAEFGLAIDEGLHLLLTGHVVRTGAGYGLTVVDSGVPMAELTSVALTFWGVPADPRHNAQRGRRCVRIAALMSCEGQGNEPSGDPLVPFLTLPTDCAAGPETGSISVDSWENAGDFVEGPKATLPAATGCDALGFDPSLALEPDTTQADEPVGLNVDLGVPQNENPVLPATPQVRNTVVTLPPGLSVSPGVVDGVAACNESGPEGINFEGPESEEVGLNGQEQLAPGHCPAASTVGTAEAITPLLPSPVKGHIYLARPRCGGAGQARCTEADALDGDLFELYLELGGTGALGDAGVNLKVPGRASVNPSTGQITTTFPDTPQLPFSDLKVHLNGGPRAPLANPQACGEARTTADVTPWSTPVTPDTTPFSFFNVTGCAGQMGLSPGFLAGTVTPTAGAFSPFTLTFSRHDREQNLSGIQVQTPPGLLGMLSSVPLCGEPQAQQGTCPEASKIGSTMVASGAGSHPFWIGGSVYLTGPYKGAPFGLSIVTDAVAGPFNLGDVIVRAAIDIDPSTAALTITSDPLPQILDGVPLRLQTVSVNIDRPGFMFNPTNCDQQQIKATITGAQGASAAVSSPFAVAGCAGLAFHPKFEVTTSGRTSKAKGASLDAKLTYPKGVEADIASVKVDLPKQLPSRLTTLQKACTAATFNANPARCPAASVVGIARASTPLLPVTLSGPAYFVSHGGEAFPSLIVILQGEGVRVDLTGTTFISKKGITSSTFKTVPDVPVSSFELYLPEGRFSALAANENLCKAKLAMPTQFVAQNGATIHESTKIKVTGCPRGKKKTKARKAQKSSHSYGRERR